MQFVLSLDGTSTCLAWPRDCKRAGLGMHLTHEPLESIGYGSEEVAIADLDRWTDKYKNIISAECIVYGDRDAT
jgi:hypothetical protein